MKEEKKKSLLKWLLNHLWKRDKLYHLIVGTLIYIAGALIFATIVLPIILFLISTIK